MVRRRYDWGPDFADDDRFTHEWWLEYGSFGPSTHQWRSYVRGGEEIARMLLSLHYVSHSLPESQRAVLVWSFEVREDLRCSGEHLGTRIIEQLDDEYRDWELYVGSAPNALSFWLRFGWPMCECKDCRGSDMIIRRPRWGLNA